MSDPPSSRPSRGRRGSWVRTSIPPGRATLYGISASPGVAVGRVTLYDRRSVPIPRRTIAPAEVEREVERLMQALSSSRKQLEEARDALDPDAGAEHRLVLEAHLLMHRDELLVGAAVTSIRAGHNAEWAVRRSVESLVQRLNHTGQTYLADRSRDVEQVGEHVLRNLTGVGLRLPDIETETILVTSDLSPAEAARLPRDKVLALVTDFGSATSHTAILARALGIPAVVGVDGITRTLSPGDCVIVDALRGEIIVDPNELETSRAEDRARRYRRFVGKVRARPGATGRTLDGVKVELLANVELEVEVQEAEAQKAEGIGLYRTEFLYLEGDPPDEATQAAIYARIVNRLAPRLVTLRTFDLGADKMPSFSSIPSGRSLNPALGLRGLRFSLSVPELFRTQLRAMLRAAHSGTLRIMFPMVCTLDELRRAKAMLEEARAELNAEGIPHGPVTVGAMIEVPSAVMIADALARECDFFSVGTNDLAQYTLALDRQNPRVFHLARALEPSLLRMLDVTQRAAAAAGIRVCICGDLASHPMAIPVLLGMGYRSLSMATADLAVAREIVDRIDLTSCERLAYACREGSTALEIERTVVEMLGSQLAEIWEEQGIELPDAS